LNHDCAFALDPESMLLTDPPHNPFSTASTQLRHWTEYRLQNRPNTS
jgi:hypothetical protein